MRSPGRREAMANRVKCENEAIGDLSVWIMAGRSSLVHHIVFIWQRRWISRDGPIELVFNTAASCDSLSLSLSEVVGKLVLRRTIQWSSRDVLHERRRKLATVSRQSALSKRHKQTDQSRHKHTRSIAPRETTSLHVSVNNSVRTRECWVVWTRSRRCRWRCVYVVQHNTPPEMNPSSASCTARQGSRKKTCEALALACCKTQNKTTQLNTTTVEAAAAASRESDGVELKSE